MSFARVGRGPMFLVQKSLFFGNGAWFCARRVGFEAAARVQKSRNSIRPRKVALPLRAGSWFCREITFLAT